VPLRALMGQRDWHWFRYPFLHEGETLEKRHAIRSYLHEHGYRAAQVTLDFEDYAWNNPYARCTQKNDQPAIDWLKSSYMSTAVEYIAMGRKEAQQVYGRDIKHVLLLHIGAFDSIMLPELLDSLQSQGFQFVRLEEAETDPAYAKDPDAALKYGGTLSDQFMDSRHLMYPPHADKPMDKLNALCR
jgi:peptidoglycan/xylan/chitin deacetylase (PgdA/CDA1 family)